MMLLLEYSRILHDITIIASIIYNVITIIVIISISISIIGISIIHVLIAGIRMILDHVNMLRRFGIEVSCNEIQRQDVLLSVY